jgi:hypothetical protein
MGNFNKKKSEQLGMPLGTACGRLRKLIMFDLLKQLGKDICYRCNRSIDTVDELSIEHKEPWLDVNPNLFWDLNNISFSHLSCNIAHGRRKQPGPISHGTIWAYQKGCRCVDCKAVKKEDNRKQNQKNNTFEQE